MAPDSLAANVAGRRDGTSRAPAGARGDAGASVRAPGAAKVGQQTSVFGLLMTASHAGLTLVNLALTRRTDKTLIASLAFDGTWKAYRRGVNVFDSPDPFFGVKAGR